MRVAAVSFLGAVSLIAQSSSPAPLAVTSVRHWSLGEATRVAIEVTGEFHFRSDRLHNPERIYFDILNARPRFEGRRVFREEVTDPLLKRVRVAETAPGMTRIVLELADSVDAAPSLLSNPYRLVVELRPGAPPAIPPDPVVPPVISSVPQPEPARPEAPAPAKPAITTNPPASVAAKPVIAANPPATPPAKSAPAGKSEPPEPAETAAVARLRRQDPPLVETADEIKPPADRTSEAAAPATGGGPSSLPGTAAVPRPAKSARPTASGQNSLIRALGLKINRVVIDPGHGGHDQGTSGSKGLLEKDLVLDVSLRLGKLIEERMGAEVIYTRTEDNFVPLEGRSALANDKKADLFLSIHANSSPATKVAGIETYYLNFTDSQDALDVASRENASSQKSVSELRDLIQKITLHDKVEESRELAGRLQTSLYSFTSRNNPVEQNRGVKKAPFVVLVGTNMPAVLAEIGFLSNPKEEALLKKPDYRQKLAESLFRGLSRYADSLSHFQMAQN